MRIRTIAGSLSLLGIILLIAFTFADAIFFSTPGMGPAQIAGIGISALILLLSAWLFSHRRADSNLSRSLEGRMGRVTAVAIPTTVGLMIGLLVLTAALREEGSRFAYDRTTGVDRVTQLIRTYGRAGTAVCRCSPDLHASIELPGGFRTSASIYKGRGEGPRPAVVIIHGNTWLGRRLSTYRLMATLLAREGYTVLAFDRLGYGEADDRFSRGVAGLPYAYNNGVQAEAALKFLLETMPIDRSRVALLGHSGGVDTALQLAHASEDVSRVIVMVSPPPPVEGDDGVQRRAAYFSKRDRATYQFIYRKEWPDWFSWEMTDQSSTGSTDAFEPYEAPGHPPVLLVLGEQDEPRGHDAVRQRFSRIAGSKKLAFIPDSDHYLNTAQSLGFVFYHRAVAADFAREVTTWLRAPLRGSHGLE